MQKERHREDQCVEHTPVERMVQLACSHDCGGVKRKCT
jgi:hypothetical protein